MRRETTCEHCAPRGTEAQPPLRPPLHGVPGSANRSERSGQTPRTLPSRSSKTVQACSVRGVWKTTFLPPGSPILCVLARRSVLRTFSKKAWRFGESYQVDKSHRHSQCYPENQKHSDRAESAIDPDSRDSGEDHLQGNGDDLRRDRPRNGNGRSAIGRVAHDKISLGRVSSASNLYVIPPHVN